MYLQASFTAERAASEHILLLNVRALLDSPPHVTGPVQLCTWGQTESKKLVFCPGGLNFILPDQVMSDRPWLTAGSASLAQENSEEISLEISLNASSKSFPSVLLTAGINSEEGGGESSSFDWPKTEPVESRCAPL